MADPGIVDPWQERISDATLRSVERRVLASFLRQCRQRLQPGDVGLAAGRRRRTQGLRREEVAQLASISTDYYTRLEQARGPRPSAEVLAALARALRLDHDERNYLFRLAGHHPPVRRTVPSYVRPALSLVLDRLEDVPAMVVDHRGDILAWNDMHAAVFGDLSAVAPADRNVPWLFFSSEDFRNRFPVEDRRSLAVAHVAHLRAMTAAHPDDEALTRLIRRLGDTSSEFSDLWLRHDVAVRRDSVKRVLHPSVGLLELDCEVLGADDEQRLIIHTPRPGTDAAQRLDLVRVVGLQQLAQHPEG